jgi:hypothetical protein
VPKLKSKRKQSFQPSSSFSHSSVHARILPRLLRLSVYRGIKLTALCNICCVQHRVDRSKLCFGCNCVQGSAKNRSSLIEMRVIKLSNNRSTESFGSLSSTASTKHVCRVAALRDLLELLRRLGFTDTMPALDNLYEGRLDTLRDLGRSTGEKLVTSEHRVSCLAT